MPWIRSCLCYWFVLIGDESFNYCLEICLISLIILWLSKCNVIFHCSKDSLIHQLGHSHTFYRWLAIPDRTFRLPGRHFAWCQVVSHSETEQCVPPVCTQCTSEAGSGTRLPSRKTASVTRLTHDVLISTIWTRLAKPLMRFRSGSPVLHWLNEKDVFYICQKLIKN